MPAPIYIPRRQNPWTNMMPGLLQNLVLQKIGQNMRLKEKEMEIKQKEKDTQLNLKTQGFRELEAEIPSEHAIKVGDTTFEFPEKGISTEGVPPGMVALTVNGRTAGYIGSPHKPAEGPYK